MSGRRTDPPRWAERVLRIGLGGGPLSEAVAGDLREEWGEQCARLHPMRAAAWYCVRALGLALALGPWLRLRRGRSAESSVRRSPLAALESLARDLRYGIRRLRMSPGFTALVISTLALGIGANTVIFSVVDSVLLRPLPFESPDELVTVEHRYPSLDLSAPVSAGAFRSYRDDTRSFTSVAVEAGWGANMTGGGEPIRVSATMASGEYFGTLGVPAAIGRAFAPEDDVPGRRGVVVLADGLWKRQFGGDRSVLGNILMLNGEPYEVIGVMPPWFRGAFHRSAQLWVPLALTEEQYASGPEFLALVARLGPGMNLDAARQELAALAEMTKTELPGRYPPDWTLDVRTLRSWSTGSIRPVLLVMLGAVGFVLLIACANVASLLLVRATARGRETAVRLALGGRRGQIVRQLLAESVVLAVAGGLLGTGLAWAGVRTLSTVIDTSRLLGHAIGFSGPVFLWTAGLAVATGILFGLAPALRSARCSVRDALAAGGRGATGDQSGHRLRNGLVVVEFGIALTLLAGAGLLVRSLARVQALDPGFDSSNLLTAFVSLPAAQYPDASSRAAFFDRVLERIEAVPGVAAAGTISQLPFGGSWATSRFTVEGYTPPEGDIGPWGDERVVSPGYATTMGIPLLRGRFFDERDVDGTLPVVVVDEELVRRYMSDADPIGRRITFDDPADADAIWWTVIGVVGHTAHEALEADPRVQVYFTYGQEPRSGAALVVRTLGDPLATVSAITAAVQDIDPQLPLAGVAPMAQLIEISVGQRRLAVLLLGAFAAIGLFLAATGIYGVMSQIVNQRAKEMGLRMALGAGMPAVLGLVMRQGLILSGLGVGLGVAGAVALTRLLESQLYGVRATDPATFIGVTLLLTAIGLAATLAPAIRAARLDPVATLREE